jgi:small-conductance mechanosensitive channel
MLNSRTDIVSPGIIFAALIFFGLTPVFTQAQPSPENADIARVEIEPTVPDAAIAERLTRILEATGWFDDIDVQVEAGVAFLNARTSNADRRDWAERLASNTEAVTAVVNRIEIEGQTAWDLSPAWEKVRELGNAGIRHSPLVALALLLLAITWFVARSAVRGSKALLGRHVQSHLLRDVASRTIAIPVFLIGLYFVLSVLGLTGLAVTVIGSTGLIGLVLGFAFRDIAENFLASILISMNRPFATGDRIEVAGFQGFVQSVNTRSTLLMTLEGNHVQIPNATIYKGTITNFTANPKARFDFTVGIGYEDSISDAQQVALTVLLEHPAVIDDPEPAVLVEALGSSTINLRVYFWVDISRHSHNKVRSAIIRQTKTAFEQHGISMPDEAREVVFPKGVPVQMLQDRPYPKSAPPADDAGGRSADAAGDANSRIEGDYSSEAEAIERQARESRAPEGGENLLNQTGDRK